MTGRIFERSLAGNGEYYQNQLTGSSQGQVQTNEDRACGYLNKTNMFQVIHALGLRCDEMRKKDGQHGEEYEKNCRIY
jgi:hypothetical protein